MFYMIYLTAGLSRRYGSNKLLEPIDGKPMYRHMLDILTVMKEEEPHRYEVVVVTAYDEIEEAVKGLPVTVVRNAEPELGVSHSIKLGLLASFICINDPIKVSDALLTREKLETQWLSRGNSCQS